MVSERAIDGSDGEGGGVAIGDGQTLRRNGDVGQWVEGDGQERGAAGCAAVKVGDHQRVVAIVVGGDAGEIQVGSGCAKDGNAVGLPLVAHCPYAIANAGETNRAAVGDRQPLRLQNNTGR